MARTTTTPHKVSRNKSGTPIVRASKLFPGRPKRTTREMAFQTEEQARIKELERENRELRRANTILRQASAYFAQAELDRRPK